jgi:hypothetical protein
MLETQIPEICTKAKLSAQEAAGNFFRDKLGGKDQFACGFAWVDVYNVRSNSKLGKALIAQGFRKSYTKSLQLWNPSNFGCQNIDTLEHGALAYAAVLKEHGLDAYMGSRLD